MPSQKTKVLICLQLHGAQQGNGNENFPKLAVAINVKGCDNFITITYSNFQLPHFEVLTKRVHSAAL
jgi:hypothetical protein